MEHTSTMYCGYWIEFNLYGKGEYTIQINGDDVWFDTEEEAKAFIDKIEEENTNEDY